jgi:hypothetical protein
MLGACRSDGRSDSKREPKRQQFYSYRAHILSALHPCTVHTQRKRKLFCFASDTLPQHPAIADPHSLALELALCSGPSPKLMCDRCQRQHPTFQSVLAVPTYLTPTSCACEERLESCLHMREAKGCLSTCDWSVFSFPRVHAVHSHSPRAFLLAD